LKSLESGRLNGAGPGAQAEGVADLVSRDGCDEHADQDDPDVEVDRT